MDNWTAMEAAFKNGYKCGVQEARSEVINFLEEYIKDVKSTVTFLEGALEKLKGEY